MAVMWRLQRGVRAARPGDQEPGPPRATIVARRVLGLGAQVLLAVAAITIANPGRGRAVLVAGRRGRRVHECADKRVVPADRDPPLVPGPAARRASQDERSQPQLRDPGLRHTPGTPTRGPGTASPGGPGSRPPLVSGAAGACGGKGFGFTDEFGDLVESN